MQFFLSREGRKSLFSNVFGEYRNHNKRWKRNSRNETQILISDEFSKIYVRINLKIEQRINFELRFSATSRRFCQFSLLPRERTPFN